MKINKKSDVLTFPVCFRGCVGGAAADVGPEGGGVAAGATKLKEKV